MSLKLETVYNFDPRPNRPKHWVVIGAGGNGAYYIPNLVRLVSLSNHKLELQGQYKHRITIVDADNVEDKNLNRQNFIRADVGKNKAEVMANRYGRAFGVEISYVDKYIESPEMLKSILSPGMTPVIVGCVDNNKTRKIIYDVFKNQRDIFWMDAGNEEWGGQVVLGYNTYEGMPHHDRHPISFRLPSVVDLYPEILEAQDKLPHELSCAERAVSAPQNIFTNQLAATLLQGFTNLIINSTEEKGIRHHAVMFNAYTSSLKNRLNTAENLDPNKYPIKEYKPIEPKEEKLEVKEPTPKKEATQPVAVG